MSPLFKVVLSLVFLPLLSSCDGQVPGAHAMQEELSDDFDEMMPFAFQMPAELSWRDTSPGRMQKGQQITLTGIVYKRDGKTPASDVILYYYHTDIHGLYPTDETEPRNMPHNKLGQTHGYMRGWVKTGIDGKYSISTVMPGSYPSRDEPAHVHISVKEISMEDPYYVDDFVFDNDRLLTSEKRQKLENRGGSGIIRFVEEGQEWIGERNIILGLHIPDYPESVTCKSTSGKSIGEDLHSFTPYHAFGPDKGTKVCPICKYGWYHGILYFVGNNPDWEEIKKWLVFLDKESELREKYVKVFFVYGNEKAYTPENRNSSLQRLGNELQLKTIALTFVPSFSDVSSDIYLNSINQDVQNTFILYRRSNIIGNLVNLEPTSENFDKIRLLLDSTINKYFKLPKVGNNN